jgi:hypothetical protein
MESEDKGGLSDFCAESAAFNSRLRDALDLFQEASNSIVFDEYVALLDHAFLLMHSCSAIGRALAGPAVSMQSRPSCIRRRKP